MDPIEMSNVITVRPYMLKEGKMPSNSSLVSFMEDQDYPKKRMGWSYGFLNTTGSGRGRITKAFLSEVGFNIPSYKITNGEVAKLTVPQKKIEMVGIQFTRKNLEIIGTRPHATNLLLSLLKDEFDLSFEPWVNDDATLARVFEASFLIRNVRARTRIGEQDVVVGLRSGEKLEETTITPVFRRNRSFLSVGGRLRLPNKKIISFQSNASGANIFFSSKMYPVKWPDIALFMDSLIYSST